MKDVFVKCATLFVGVSDSCLEFASSATQRSLATHQVATPFAAKSCAQYEKCARLGPGAAASERSEGAVGQSFVMVLCFGCLNINSHLL